jgi:hypothetical protein
MQKGSFSISSLFMFLGTISFLSGLGVFVYQLFEKLNGGTWVGFSVVKGMSFSPFWSNWALNSSGNLHDTLTRVPLTFFLIALALLFYFIGTVLSEN